MNFASDNVAGASPKVMQAIVEANHGAMKSYGVDDLTISAEKQLQEIFETDLEMFTVATGTAANALALSAMTPSWGAVLSHPVSHVSVDECAAPEFFSGGAKIVGLPGVGAKPLAADLAHFFATTHFRPIHQVKISALAVSQATECGLIYRPAEISELAGLARQHGLNVHMDGARFANALVAQNATPAELTWKAGVQALSFGGTKNGCLSAEAVIFFDKSLAQDFAYRRKRAGQLLSKGRLFGAQISAYLADDHWLDLARHANAMAKRLSDGLAAAGAPAAWPTQANEVFPILPKAMHERLTAAGAIYYPWVAEALPDDVIIKSDTLLVRMVTSFATQEADVDAMITTARG